MLVAEKYHLQREIGWSDEAEVHIGPPGGDQPVAVKIRHGMGGPPRPDGNRERFLRAVQAQQAVAVGGCRQVAPIFDSGHEGDNAFYVTRQYPRSLDSLISGHAILAAPVLHRITSGVLQALEELRDRGGRSHGNLKPTNIFLDGKTPLTSTVILGDLAEPERTGGQIKDCQAFGAVLLQLVRGRALKHFDWPIQNGPDWERLGRQADAWREFCNLLLAPNQPAEALQAVREAFRRLRHLRTVTGAEHGAKSTKPTPGRGRKSPVLALVGIAALVGLGGGAYLYWNSTSPHSGRETRLSPTATQTPGTEPDASVEPSATASLASPALAQSPPETSGSPMLSSTEPLPTLAPAAPDLAPTPVNNDKWIGYIALLTQYQSKLTQPNELDRIDAANADLSRLKDDIGYLPVKGEPDVDAFLQRLPPKLESTGDQPDLPATLWTKEGVTRQGDVESDTFQWGHTGFRLIFNRVKPAAGGAPPFYLCATTVPLQFGSVLAKLAESDGKGPLSGASSVKGPVAWQYVQGAYVPRASWMLLDSINATFYANAGRPTYESPMNGLSPMEAVRLARAAGAQLPTLAQWDAVLASPAGQAWVAQWQALAKVRSPQWSTLAKGILAQHLTGGKLPNDQCFGDHTDLSGVTTTASQDLFFEPVSKRSLNGYSHLIGNVGQYLVDDARNPTKYYFAGGSAEAAPAVFQSLTNPPVVSSPFLSAADGGLRLAVPAKGGGSDEKNPAFDKLKGDVVAELARVQKLP